MVDLCTCFSGLLICNVSSLVDLEVSFSPVV